MALYRGIAGRRSYKFSESLYDGIEGGPGYTQVMARTKGERVKLKTEALRTAVRLHDLVLEPLADAGLLTIDVADLASPGYDVTINTRKLNDLLNNPRRAQGRTQVMAELNHHTPSELQTASEQEQAATIEGAQHRPPLCVKCGGSCETVGTVRVCFDCDAVQLSPVLEPLNKHRT